MIEVGLQIVAIATFALTVCLFVRFIADILG
jgi:hypothetical protein